VNEIPDRQDALDAFARTYLMPEPNGNGYHKAATASYTPTDEEVLQQARKARNAAKFATLFDDGDTTAYDRDHNRADQGLIRLLAFYTQDPLQLEQLFRKSALMRPKWERRDYRAGTINKVLADQRETFAWQRPVTVTVTPNRDGNGNGSPSALPQAVRFIDMGTPQQRRYLVGGLVPEAYPTVVYGDGGVAKSMLALSASLAVAGGADSWLGCPVQGGAVLYVDFELDAQEQNRRVSQLVRGAGLPGVPEGLLYMSALGYPARAAFEAALKECKARGVKLMILDSLGPALQGDAEAARDVIAFYQAVVEPFRAAGVTVVVVDHQSKLQGGERYQSKRAFGSVFKGNLARSVIQVEATDRQENKLALRLRQVKHNFGTLADPLGIELCFTEEMVTVQQVELEGSELAEEQTLNAKTRVLYALHDGPAFPSELAEATGLARGTVKKELSKLRQAGKVEDTGEQEQGGGHKVRIVTVTDTNKGNGNGNGEGVAF
jgi:DNA-binding transcriptional ArsR family regulator